MMLLYCTIYLITFIIVCKLHYSSQENVVRWVDSRDHSRSGEKFVFRVLEEHHSGIKKGRLNQHPRYMNMTIKNITPQKKLDEILVFIAITSSRDHTHLRQGDRNTWLLPCILSPVCEYRFFIDVPSVRHTLELAIEVETYRDIVLRDSCSLMKRHFDAVHYGNSPPVKENDIDVGHTLTMVEEVNRLNYKIDWKVCFMQYMVKEKLSGLLNVFVEDDSFICTENLIFQASRLSNMSRNGNVTIPEFRTGTRLFDGFDDSSTIITSGIVKLFVEHYPHNGLSCDKVFNDIFNQSMALENHAWLSWGNSWSNSNCGWKQQILDKYHMKIQSPNMNCLSAISETMNVNNHGERVQGLTYLSPKQIQRYQTVAYRLNFPCLMYPIIFHHNKAADVILHSEADTKSSMHSSKEDTKTKDMQKIQASRVCESTLLIDKVKSVDFMYDLWNTAIDDNYFDYSDVFMSDNNIGWLKKMKEWEANGGIGKAEAALNSPERRLSLEYDERVRLFLKYAVESIKQHF